MNITATHPAGTELAGLRDPDIERHDTGARDVARRTPAAASTVAAALRGRIAGEVVAPGDDGYDTARAGWNLTSDHRPSAVVVAADVYDVAATLEIAAALGVGVGVQSTGHGAVVPVDGVLLLTCRLASVTIDPLERTARVGAGATWGDVLAAAQRHGLAPLLGSSPTVGAVGYTLGGGFGWLARKYGPACDSARSFEVVVPGGRLVTTSATERTELFTALRGGGGGAIGVVTSMEIELYPVTDVYAGNLFYPADAAQQVADAYVRWIADAPDDLTSSIVFVNYPPLPDVPEPLRGRSFTVVRGCWAGPIAAGETFVDRLRAELAPEIDMWSTMPFAASAAISHDPADPLPVVGTGAWLDRLDRETVATFAAATFAASPGPVAGPPALLLSEIRHVGGAVASNPRDLSAMGNRDGRFVFHSVGVPMAPGADGVIRAHLDELKRSLGSAISDRIYLNFVDGQERRRRCADGVDPGRHQRIADVHRWFDPDETLRYGVMPPC